MSLVYIFQIFKHKNMPNGNKLKEIRKSLDLSQVKMADLLEIDQSHYSNIERCKKNASSKVIELLFSKLNVSPDWFFMDKGEMFSTYTHEQSKEDIQFHHEGDEDMNKKHQNMSFDHISRYAKTIDDGGLDSMGVFPDVKDPRVLYTTNEYIAHINFTRQLLESNDLINVWHGVRDIYSSLSTTVGLLEYYSIESLTSEKYKEFYNKKTKLADVLDSYKRSVEIMKRIHTTLLPMRECAKKMEELINEIDDQYDEHKLTYDI